MSWTIKAKVINEMHRAQRQAVLLTSSLNDFILTQKGCVCTSTRIGIALTELVDGIANNSGATMIALTLRYPDPKLNLLRSVWAELADALHCEVDMQTMPIIEKLLNEVHKLLMHLTHYQIVQNEENKKRSEQSDFVKRSRN